jgi:YVTN family beta-propeller protein
MDSRLPLRGLVLLALASSVVRAQAPSTTKPYSLYITSEAGDKVTRIDVDTDGWRNAKEIPVGIKPGDVDGPHNIALSPDGQFWYISIAHGTPWGTIWKYATGADTALGNVRVGMFPTTVGLSPDGSWAYVPNSDFHGDRGKENTVSVVHTPTMREVAQLRACDMPHGSKSSRGGASIYIACMMSDELLVIDPSQLAVTRRVSLGSGRMSMSDHAHPPGDSVRLPVTLRGAASSTMPGQNPDCLTTYVSVSPDDRLLYLACNHSNEVQVRDARTLEVVRRLPTAAGAYNVEPSPDGRWVLVTNKKAQSVSVFDTRNWTEAARIQTSKTVPHGIAFSPDGRYAFVTTESVGNDPGAVDAIDLATLARVASIPIGSQPTGIAVWVRE